MKATYGSSDTENYYASTSGNIDNSSYRLTVGKRRDDGFDIRARRAANATIRKTCISSTVAGC